VYLSDRTYELSEVFFGVNPTPFYFTKITHSYMCMLSAPQFLLHFTFKFLRRLSLFLLFAQTKKVGLFTHLLEVSRHCWRVSQWIDVEIVH